MGRKAFQEKLTLLKKLAGGDVKIIDKNGFNVSPRTKEQIRDFPELVEKVKQLLELEKKAFYRLTKQWRDLNYEIKFLCENWILKEFTDSLVANVSSGTWILQEQQSEEIKEVAQ